MQGVHIAASGLDNREVALLILLGLGVLWAFWHRSARSAIGGVLKSAVQPVILIPFAGLVASVGGLVLLGEARGLWEPALVPATVAWVLTQGVVLLYGIGTRKAGEPFFRPTLASMLRLTWLIEVFVGFYVLGVVAELVLLVILVMLGALSAVGASKDEYKPIRPWIEGMIAVIGLGLLLYVAVNVIADWDVIDKAFAARAFLLPVGLTVGCMPYLYWVSLWAGYHDAFIWINAETDDRGVRRRAKLGLILALRLRASRASAFRTYWARKITEADDLAAARDIGREFLRDQRRDEDERKEAADRLVRYAGVDGEDEDGRRLDQREFAETKKTLQWLGTMQMGWYNNRGGRYRSELLGLLSPDELPEDHGIQLNVAKDGQSWWAWRRTVTGWCFAIGASEKPPDQWLHDGFEPPKDSPGKDPAWGDRWGIDAKNW